MEFALQALDGCDEPIEDYRRSGISEQVLAYRIKQMLQMPGVNSVLVNEYNSGNIR
jgi:hypothetical protein